jgi:hypothetical protein
MTEMQRNKPVRKLNAVTSLGSDLDKHPELGCNPYLLMAGMMDAQNGEREKVRRWIEGFR